MQAKIFVMDRTYPAWPQSVMNQCAFTHELYNDPLNQREPVLDNLRTENCLCGHGPCSCYTHTYPFCPSYVSPEQAAEQYIKPNVDGQFSFYPEHGTQPLDSQNRFLAGYTDCAREAIRYLIEEEGLPWTHPTVIGLRSHLQEQSPVSYLQYMLQSDALLCENATNTHNPSKTGDETKNAHSDLARTTVPNAQSHTTVEERLDHIVREHTSDLLNVGQNCETAEISDKGRCGVDQQCLNGSQGECEWSSRLERHEDAQDTKEMIAAKLAEEIFHLLQGDFEMTDTEDDSDDEGFEEIIEQ